MISMKGYFIGRGAAPVKGIAIGELSATEGVRISVPVNGNEYIWWIVQHGPPSALYDNTFLGRTIMLMEGAYESRAWGTSTNNNYAESTIHPYLNSTFYNLIDEKVRGKLAEVNIPYRAANSATATTIGNLNTKVFLIAAKEVNRTDQAPDDGVPFEYFKGAGDAKRSINMDWWTRSPLIYNNSTKYVIPIGPVIPLGVMSTSKGIRPCIVLPSDLMVSEEPDIRGVREVV